MTLGRCDGGGTPTQNMIWVQPPGHLLPDSNGGQYCGDASQPWAGVESYNFYTATSSAAAKDQITSVETAKCLAIVEQLRPVTFRYRNENLPAAERDRLHAGFIAEELLAALEEKGLVCGAVKRDGDHMGLAYNELVAVLWGAVQALAKK